MGSKASPASAASVGGQIAWLNERWRTLDAWVAAIKHDPTTTDASRGDLE